MVVTVLEDGAVLLDLDTKYFYSVNSTGWSILQLFESGSTKERVLAQCHEWGAPAADTNTIKTFLEKLTNDKLLTSVDDPPPQQEISLNSAWVPPTLEKHKEPLQRVMVSAFDPSIPLAE